jgi:hypothetical protein
MIDKNGNELEIFDYVRFKSEIYRIIGFNFLDLYLQDGYFNRSIISTKVEKLNKNEVLIYLLEK